MQLVVKLALLTGGLLSGLGCRSKQSLIPNEHLSSGIPLAPISREQALENQLRKQQALETVRARDIAAGINAEARAAEDTLKATSASLTDGMTPAAVIALLGKPETVQAFVTIDGFRQRDVITLEAQATAKGETFYTYFPFQSVRGDDRNGMSWQVLTVQFDEQRKVVKWAWETPLFWRPSMKFPSAPLVTR